MRAVIFDMDGLMFDTEAVHVKAWNYAGERMGLGRAGEMVLKTMGTNAAMTGSGVRAAFRRGRPSEICGRIPDGILPGKRDPGEKGPVQTPPPAEGNGLQAGGGFLHRACGGDRTFEGNVGV